MPDETTPGSSPPAPRRRAPWPRRGPLSGRRKAFVVAAWTAAGLVVVGGSGLGYLYARLNGNIHGVDINAALGSDRPRDAGHGSMDVLVLGSDSRSGANAKYGKDGGGARSDTAMVMHVYPGHRKASVVSIPRDTLVHRPGCESRKGGFDRGGERQMFNTAYEIGGPACAVKTVEAMSGIRMDHYVEVDFTGFRKLIDTLGGVDITTSEALNDDKSHLHLKPGRHTLTGEQALGLVRTRHGVGDGSDLGRIRLQQAFVKALTDRVRHVGVFDDPRKLYRLADTATGAVTTDTGLDSVKRLAGFANGLKDIGRRNMRMVTLPVRYDSANANRVLPLDHQDQRVWAALKADKPIPADVGKDSAGDGNDTDGVVSGG